jgi:hypothetical protein
MSTALHIAGCICSACSFALAGEVLIQALRQWPRIWSTACGRHLEPVSSTNSVSEGAI